MDVEDREVDGEGRIGVNAGDDVICTAEAFPVATYEWVIEGGDNPITGNTFTVTNNMVSRHIH